MKKEDAQWNKKLGIKRCNGLYLQKRTENIQTKYTFSKYTLKYTFSKYTYSKEVHKGSTQRDNINYERTK